MIAVNGSSLTYTGASTTANHGFQTSGAVHINVPTAGAVLTVAADNANNNFGAPTLYKVGDGTLRFSSSAAGTYSLGYGIHCNQGTVDIQSSTGATFTLAGDGAAPFGDTAITLGESGFDWGNGNGTMTLGGNATLKVTGGQSYVGGYWHGDFVSNTQPVGTLMLNDSSTAEFNGWLVLGLYSGKGFLNVGPSATVIVHNNLALGYNWGDQASVYGYGEVTTAGHIVQDTTDRIHIVQYGGTGIWTQNGGLTETTSTVQLAEADAYLSGFPSSATLNLNGGTFQAPGFFVGVTLVGREAETLATVNFNGGALKASASNADFIANTTGATLTLNVLKNAATHLGAVIDTNGFAVAINQPLVHASADAIDGGLKKLGAGTLTLTDATSNYTGPTKVMGGVLSIANIASSGSPSAIGASSDDAANLVIGNGGELLYTGGLVTTTRGLDLGPGTGIISGPITFLGTVGDNLLGDGNLEKAGPDKLTLAGPVTYTGTTAIDAGVLQIDTAGAVTLSTITGAGTLGIGSGTTLTATSINVGTLVIGAEASASAATAVPEPGALVLLALAGMGILLAACRRK